MNQPTFSEGPPVPLMVEGTLDAAMLEKLFSDLSSAATVLSIREKGHPTVYANPDEMTLPVAADRLRSGKSRAVQIRYRHDGFEWTDTILALVQGYRVVRCRHDAA